MKPDICQNCPAYNEPGPVWQQAVPTPRIGIFGEAPGPQEVEKGQPFFPGAPSGGLLYHISKIIGLRRDECYLSNVAKCITKDSRAFQYCWNAFGKAEVEALPEHLPILALGNEAKNVLAPNMRPWGITTCRGARFGRVYVGLHPSFIRRTAQGESEGTGGEEKQDLTPTLAYDISSALNHYRLEASPPRIYTEGIAQCQLNGDWDFISTDLETAGKLDPRDGPIDQIGFCTGPGRVYREKYREDHRQQYMRILHSGKRIVYHFGQFDAPYYEYHGYPTPPMDKYEDTMLGLHLLNPDLPLGLEMVNSLYTHYPPWWAPKAKKKELWQTPAYHATDLDVTWQGWRSIEADLKAEGKWQLYRTESVPVAYGCMELKKGGIRIDKKRVAKMHIVWSKRILEIEAILMKIAPINWASPVQVKELLYDKWHMPLQYTGAGWAAADKGPKRITTNEVAIANLIELTGHPALKLLLIMRQLMKQRSMWLEWKLDDKDFYHFDISFTNATGRAKGDILVIQHGAMRSIFIPDEDGWEFAEGDWSAVELWIGAIVSGDKHYQEVLSRGGFHEYAGTRILGRKIDKRQDVVMYTDVKRISHGVAYGRGAKAISEAFTIPQSRVHQYIAFLKSEFPIWWAWRENQVAMAEREGKLTNVFGLTRYFWSGNIRGSAFAMEPQSDVAHMIKRTMLMLQAQLPKPARMVLPWHDACLITYPPEVKQEALTCLKECMECAWQELGGWSGKAVINVGKNLQEASEEQ